MSVILLLLLLLLLGGVVLLGVSRRLLRLDAGAGTAAGVMPVEGCWCHTPQRSPTCQRCTCSSSSSSSSGAA